MSDHYHGADDLKLLKDMKQLAPEGFTAWLNLNSIVGRDGAIPKKYRELIIGHLDPRRSATESKRLNPSSKSVSSTGHKSNFA